jgi:uncharacterized protein with PIN domain
MPTALIRFYAELNDHLSSKDRYRDSAYHFEVSATIGGLLRDRGVPENEVDLILVNGTSVDFDHVLRDNDRISVYPVCESLDISSLTRIGGRPLRRPQFVLDCHLGKLAYYLRMLGFDTLYRSDFHDDELVRLSTAERRTLLSRDRRLIGESPITRGYRVRETDPKLQAGEVLQRFDLFGSVLPLQRCLRCNVLLRAVGKEAVIGKLPPMVKERYEEFQTCTACGRVYWKGTHYQRMQEFIAEVISMRTSSGTIS